MSIYNPQKNLPYVYICREKNSSNFYIGYRYRNRVPANEDFGKYYFTSNDYVKLNFQNFDYEILAEFDNRKDALAYESKLIKEMKSEYMLNRGPTAPKKAYQTNKIVDTTEKICALPECNKVHTNWKMKCCCLSHQRRYAGLRSRKKI
jgi:hypothetical protein